MKRIEFIADDESHFFEIPENWSEVNVEQFCGIMEAQEVLESIKNPILASVKMINIITGIPEDIIMMTPVDEIKKISESLEFTNTEVESIEKESLIVDGQEFFLKKDYNSLTMGEVITIDTLTQQTNNNIFKALDKLLCVFLRKKKENGKLETFRAEFLGRAELFKKVSIADVYQTIVFFSNGKGLLDNNTKVSSEKQ